MKKIFFFARDPGGANALIPVIINTRSKYRIIVYGKDYAIDRFRSFDIECNDILKDCGVIEEDCVYRFLKEVSPDMVFTGTSADDFTEKYLWIAAKKQGIISVALIDSWINYGIRFSEYSLKDISLYAKSKEFKYLPDYIFTIDDYSKGEMMKEGLPESIIYVTGQPYLQYIRNRILQVDETDVRKYRKSIECSEKTKLIVYASDDISKTYNDSLENMFWGYNEKTIFSYVYKALNDFCLKGEDFILLIRPHPKEDIDYWNDVVKKIPQMKVIIDKSTKGDTIIKSADLIIGMQSMFLLEAVLAHKEIISLQIGCKREEPFILSKLGIVQSVFDFTIFRNIIERFFKGQKQSIKWNISDNALNKIDSVIKELLWEN